MKLFTSSHIAQSLEMLFQNRRHFFQDADAHPPLVPSLLFLVLVSLELGLASALLNNSGMSGWILGTMGSLALLSALNGLMVKMGGTVAGFFGKKGSALSAFTLLNFGLWPAFLYLPIVFLAWFSGDFGALKLIVGLIVFLMVFKNWREGLEVAYELSPLQSGLASYGTFISAAFLFLVAVYAFLIGSLSTSFTP